MPADALAFAVFVGRQNQFVGVLEGGLELADDLFLFLGDHVQRVEIGRDVDPQRGPGLLLDFGRNVGGAGGQIADVPHAGQHFVVASQKTVDFSGLGGRFDDHQPFEFVLFSHGLLLHPSGL